MRTRINNFNRDDAVLYDELVIINIFQEQVESSEPLLNAFLHKCPLFGSDNTRYDIKRKYLFYTLVATVNGKSDPLAHKQPFGQFFFSCQIVGRFFRQVIYYFTVMGSYRIY